MFCNPIVKLVCHGAGCLAACYFFFCLVVGVPHTQAFILAVVAVIALASIAVGFVCADRAAGLPLKRDRKSGPLAAAPHPAAYKLDLPRKKSSI